MNDPIPVPPPPIDKYEPDPPNEVPCTSCEQKLPKSPDGSHIAYGFMRMPCTATEAGRAERARSNRFWDDAIAAERRLFAEQVADVLDEAELIRDARRKKQSNGGAA